MGAKYLFYMKSIETHARAFLALIILPIGTVYELTTTFKIESAIDFEVVTVHLIRFFQVNGFQGILQTSGFLAPGKKFGQLEVYNEENYLGPWDIASSSEVE